MNIDRAERRRPDFFISLSSAYQMRLTALFQRLISAPEFGPLVLLVAEILVFTVRSPAFLSTSNISNLLAFTPELGMITLGMTLLMTAGEFDLSVGSVFGFAPIMMWTFYNTHAGSLEVGFLFALVIAALVGFINGWMVTRLRIPSFLVTLGMQFVVRGTALYITDGFPQHTWAANSTLTSLIVGQFSVGALRIYASLLWFILFAVILGYVLTHSKGRQLDSGCGRQRVRGSRARCACHPNEDIALHSDSGHLRLRRYHQLNSGLRG